MRISRGLPKLLLLASLLLRRGSAPLFYASAVGEPSSEPSPASLTGEFPGKLRDSSNSSLSSSSDPFLEPAALGWSAWFSWTEFKLGAEVVGGADGAFAIDPVELVESTDNRAAGRARLFSFSGVGADAAADGASLATESLLGARPEADWLEARRPSCG